ncbi:MAG TPA: cytidylate kinase-like family protein [Blastocatellia bacterium]|nr:cytidylate kinase-like family protein [Blastocatellia bacterium]
MKTVITISRQLGSGGSYIGQILATRLGLKYVDREVLHLAAQEFGCDTETVEARAERISSFWSRIIKGLTFGAPDGPYTPPPLRDFSDRELFEKQIEIVKKIADKNDCVVIGWPGLYLPRHPRRFSIFCHAPLGFRVKRSVALGYAPNADEARQVIQESDEMRKRYHATMSGQDWACAENYHLTLDTSLLPLDELAEVIIDLAKRKGIV